ncbi:MAG: NTP transferase domain-containing protein [Thermoanaerobaculales bacterium]|nr:NTP transferase domain-containing protein [Thermoanaerobaculales bacterium]
MQSEDWERLAVLPVDHPLVRPESIRALAAVDGRAVIPSYQGKHGHPIVVAREVAAAIVCGDFDGPTMREILRAVAAIDLEVDDPGVTANCNTPTALAAALTHRDSS